MDNFLKNNSYFYISIGSVPAALLRWKIDEIFIVNIIGCFLLGFVNSLPISRKYKLIFAFGFCGSLTTFSGWSLHLFELISQGLYKLFFFNTILMLFLGCFSVCLGNLLAKKINP